MHRLYGKNILCAHRWHEEVDMGETGKKYKDLLTFVLLEPDDALIFFLASTGQRNLEFSELEEKF